MIRLLALLVSIFAASAASANNLIAQEDITIAAEASATTILSADLSGGSAAKSALESIADSIQCELLHTPELFERRISAGAWFFLVDPGHLVRHDPTLEDLVKEVENRYGLNLKGKISSFEDLDNFVKVNFGVTIRPATVPTYVLDIGLRSLSTSKDFLLRCKSLNTFDVRTAYLGLSRRGRLKPNTAL